MVDSGHDEFAAYLKATREKVQRYHGDVPTVIDAIVPRDTAPPAATGRAAILIHGLLDTCASMSRLHHYFAEKHFHTRSILLPGHGTRPQDLLSITWQDWHKTVQLAIDTLPASVRKITLVGLSAGGCLATHLAHHHPRVDAAMVFAPAFGLGWHHEWVVHTLQCWNKRHGGKYQRPWLCQNKELTPFKYHSIPTSAVHELLLLAGATRNAIYHSPFQKPLFVVSSCDDETVSSARIAQVFSRSTHPNSRHVLYAIGRRSPPAHPRQLLRTTLPLTNVINVSHIAMHVFPDHPLFGQPLFDANRRYGALTRSNRWRYGRDFKRLTFNPDHLWLKQRMDTFITDTIGAGDDI